MAEPDEVSDERDSLSTAWGILSSPRVFLGLTMVLGVVLGWAQTVPQRPAPGELAPLAPFAEAEALGALGLDNAFVSWPVLLIGLLLVLVAAGMLMRRARTAATPDIGSFVARHQAVVPEPLDAVRARLAGALGKERLALRDERGAVVVRTGLSTEAGLVVIVGIMALVAALFIGRANGLDGRLSLSPGRMGDAAELVVRDGDLMLPRALPLDLRCERPDPLDPARRLACTFTTGATSAPEALTLSPGTKTGTSAGLTLTPHSATRRPFSPDEAFELLVRRGPAAPAEKVVLPLAQPVELAATGDKLQAFLGPDGPLVLVTGKDRAPVLLAPPTRAMPSASLATPDTLTLEVVPPIRQVFQLTATPERLLTILGLAFLVLGLLGMALLPGTTVTLTPATNGTRVTVLGNDAQRVARIGRHLGGATS